MPFGYVLNITPDQVAAVAPVITVIHPVTQVATPQITALAQSITPVTPAVTVASRVVTGGFIEYLVPKPTAYLQVSRFFRSDADGNKVGLLRS